MPMRFDATLKDLVQSFLPDYERQLDLTDLGPLRPLNVDLSTISAATDIVLAHADPPETIVDLNFQASRDKNLAARVLLYNSLLYHRFKAPVHSLIVLLRPEADDRHLTGRVRYQVGSHKSRMDFAYEVVRLWQLPVDRFLQGGLGAAPLATLAKYPANVSAEAGLAQVVGAIFERLSREKSPAAEAKVLTASYVLSGLRVSREIAKKVFEGVQAVEESTTYQAIVEEGQIREVRKLILRHGKRKFGRPTAAVTKALEASEDLDRLERLLDRVFTATSWQALLDAE